MNINNFVKFPRQENFPNLDGMKLTPESLKRSLKDNYSDPKIKEMFEGFTLDMISDDEDEN